MKGMADRWKRYKRRGYFDELITEKGHAAAGGEACRAPAAASCR
jgi:hypothetical protein